jgi:hypothetical protein
MIDRNTGVYETVAASQTAQRLGSAGAKGDYISHVLIIPATTTPGVVTLLDGATSIALFVGGASSVADLAPIFVPLDMVALNHGGFAITTGANVSAIAVGNFS